MWDSSIDFCAGGPSTRLWKLLSRPPIAPPSRGGSATQQARQVAIFGIGGIRILAEYTGRLFSRIGLPSSVLRTGFSLAEQLIGLPSAAM